MVTSERSRLSNELYFTMRRCYKPIIAAINGGCIAQGAGLALLSDIRIMSNKKFFLVAPGNARYFINVRTVAAH